MGFNTGLDNATRSRVAPTGPAEESVQTEKMSSMPCAANGRRRLVWIDDGWMDGWMDRMGGCMDV